MNIKKLEKLNEIEFMLNFRNIWESEVKKYLLKNDVYIDDSKSIAKALFSEMKSWRDSHHGSWSPRKMENYEMLHKLVIYSLNFSHTDMREFKKRSQIFKNVRFKRYLLNILLENSKDNKTADWNKIYKFNISLRKILN